MTRFKPSKWNGRKRRKPVEPFVVLHCTAGNRQRGIDRYTKYFERATRHACYHYLAEDDGSRRMLLNPADWVAYHSRNGGNKGIGIAGCYGYEWVSRPSGPAGMWALAIMVAMADCVLDAEEATGLRIPRVKRTNWKRAKRSGNTAGFWAHADTDPRRRSDPLWDDEDWKFFLEKVLPAREADRQGK